MPDPQRLRVATEDDSPAAVAARAQRQAAEAAQAVADGIVRDYESVVERAKVAFDFTAMDPQKREFMRVVAAAGGMHLKSLGPR